LFSTPYGDGEVNLPDGGRVRADKAYLHFSSFDRIRLNLNCTHIRKTISIRIERDPFVINKPNAAAVLGKQLFAALLRFLLSARSILFSPEHSLALMADLYQEICRT